MVGSDANFELADCLILGLVAPKNYGPYLAQYALCRADRINFS